MLDRLVQLTGVRMLGKHKQAITPTIRHLTLVVQTGKYPAHAVKQYPTDKLNTAIRTAVGIVKQNRGSICAVFDGKTKLAKIQLTGIFGGKVSITRYYGNTKTRETLRRRDIEGMEKETYV